MGRLFRKCPHCSGSGRAEITGVYLETFKLVLANPNRCGASLGEMAGCSGEAMCNRLVTLESYGLVKSKTYGRRRLWQAINKKGL